MKWKTADGKYNCSEARFARRISNAIDEGVFQSNADNATLEYLSAAPNTNPLYEDLVLSGRTDYVVALTITDIMNSLMDPRRTYYFSDNITENGDVVYVGDSVGTLGAYSEYTHVSPQFRDPTFPGFMLSYSELQFYLAEAVERGFISNGSAGDYYNEGIRSSILLWGGTESEADDYLTNPDVAYSTAEGDWDQKIGTQAWIAFYNQPFVAWTEWRRLDYPIFTPPPALTYSDIPTRYTYPINEQTLNGANYTEAAQAIGGDTKTTLLFWDEEQGPPE